MNQIMAAQNCPHLQYFASSLYSARKIAFFDRDGTLNHDDGYTHKKEDLRLLPQGIEVLGIAIKSGWTPVVVSNQSGISRGYYTLDSAREFNSGLRQALLQIDLTVDYFIFCIHDNSSNCEFRKPESGMLDLVLDSTQTDTFVMFGNSITDKDAAAKAKIVYSDISKIKDCISILDSN
jgi:histidinol-phosphate phosphatase family protein